MNSKLSREENVQAVFDLKAGYTLGLADVEILKRVARMALAAMGGEPVMFCSEETLAAARDGEHLLRTLSSPSGECAIPLYRHAQQPVVPECFVRFHDIIKERHHGRMPEEVQNAFDECSAVLQAGNSPVIPDTWIPVNERMPEEGETVLGCCGLNGRHSGIYTMRASVIHRKNSAIDTYGIKHERVTHWMPLPNSPQEPKP